MDEWKFQASIHGVDVSKDGGNKPAPTIESNRDDTLPMFGDPEAYQSMSLEEREAETKKMMKKHQVWSNDPYSKG